MNCLRFFPSMAVFALLGIALPACNSTGDPQSPDPASSVPASPAEFELGRLIYDTHCARCHGADGKSDGYPFILTLDGIGDRYTLEQILEETWATGFVAPQQFSPEEQRAMAVYVATL